MSEERAKILQMLADGKISAEQAAQLLSALNAENDSPLDATPAADATPPGPMPYFGSLWLIPMYAGLALFVCGALAAFPLYAASGGWALAVCGWPIFLIGLLTMIAAWLSRQSRWIHIRITRIDGARRNLRFSFPIPLRLSAWALSIGSCFIPRLRRSGVDEMIAALNEGLSGDQPLYVDVQEGEEGERVQVYIG